MTRTGHHGSIVLSLEASTEALSTMVSGRATGKDSRTCSE